MSSPCGDVLTLLKMYSSLHNVVFARRHTHKTKKTPKIQGVCRKTIVFCVCNLSFSSPFLAPIKYDSAVLVGSSLPYNEPVLYWGQIDFWLSLVLLASVSLSGS